MPEEHTYLGDGAYATFDGYSIIVKANHHETPTDQVFLEPSAIRNLIRFAESHGLIENKA